MNKPSRMPLAALLLFAAWPAGAAELLGKERVELTPFFGYRIGGQFDGLTGALRYQFDESTSYGGLVDVNLLVDNYKLEFLWSHQKTRLERPVPGASQPARLQVDHFQAGVMQEVGRERARFAVSALVGGTRFASPGLGSDARFSGSIGGSLKAFASPRLGLRLDARAYGVYVKGVGGAFCGNGTCLFAYAGNMMWQGEFTGGVTFAF